MPERPKTVFFNPKCLLPLPSWTPFPEWIGLLQSRVTAVKGGGENVEKRRGCSPAFSPRHPSPVGYDSEANETTSNFLNSVADPSREKVKC